MRNALALIVGLLFGLGLCLSGMSQPTKVLGFLDLGGAWDPSLAFVMAGAIAVAAPAFVIARRRRLDWLGGPMDLLPTRPVDAPLAVGALIFGVGWGLAGVCPGPALVDVGFGSSGALVFVIAMAVGMIAYRALALGLRGRRVLTQDA